MSDNHPNSDSSQKKTSLSKRPAAAVVEPRKVQSDKVTNPKPLHEIKKTNSLVKFSAAGQNSDIKDPLIGPKQQDENTDVKKAKKVVIPSSGEEEQVAKKSRFTLGSLRWSLHHIRRDQKKEKEMQKREEEAKLKYEKLKAKHRKKQCASFPCCCALPLDIGVQLLCIADMFSSFVFLIIWSILMEQHLFTVKSDFVHLANSNRSNNGDDFRTTTLKYADPRETTTTTTKPPWTLRSKLEETKLHNERDQDKDSKIYSVIAKMTTNGHETIEKNCGHAYLKNYLTYENLEHTQAIWSKKSLPFIIGDKFCHFSFFAYKQKQIVELCQNLCPLIFFSTLAYIEHRIYKLVLILLWYVQWIPLFISLQGLIVSQSRRLCILEYGWANVGYRWQSVLLGIFLCRIFIYKLYQQLVTFLYIRELLLPGFLVDENDTDGDGDEPAQFARNPFGFIPQSAGAGVFGTHFHEHHLQHHQHHHHHEHFHKRKSSSHPKFKTFPEEHRIALKEDAVTDIIDKLQMKKQKNNPHPKQKSDDDDD